MDSLFVSILTHSFPVDIYIYIYMCVCGVCACMCLIMAHVLLTVGPQEIIPLMFLRGRQFNTNRIEYYY